MLEVGAEAQQPAASNYLAISREEGTARERGYKAGHSEAAVSVRTDLARGIATTSRSTQCVKLHTTLEILLGLLQDFWQNCGRLVLLPFPPSPFFFLPEEMGKSNAIIYIVSIFVAYLDPSLS